MLGSSDDDSLVDDVLGSGANSGNISATYKNIVLKATIGVSASQTVSNNALRWCLK